MEFVYPTSHHLVYHRCVPPQMSFPHPHPPPPPPFFMPNGLPLPPPPFFRIMSRPLPVRPSPPQLQPQIRQVWAHNVEAEFNFILATLISHTCASMDTEFPGTIYKPDKPFYAVTPDERYRILKSNVDALKLIQVGLTLSDPTGRLPDFTWEFNLRGFDIKNDQHNAASISLLKEQGIDFNLINKEGIDSELFAKYLLASGLIGNGSRVSWVAFSGSYDFAYLVKIISQKALPDTMQEFLEALKGYFGDLVFDIKYVRKFCTFTLHGGLENTADQLNVQRVTGKCHQAGSDSLLTAQVWRRLREMMTHQGWNGHGNGVLCGLQEI